MSEHETREQTVTTIDAFFTTLEEMNIPAFLGLWHDNGTQHMPFSPDNFPKVLDGKEVIRKQYGGLPNAYKSMRFTERRVMPLLDPTMAVVQYHGKIEQNDGQSYNNDYIGVFEVIDGKIVSFTEYFNPLILMRSFGDKLEGTFNVEGHK